MILVSYRRTEQSKNAVAGGLRDVTAVALHRLHHQLECRVDNATSFLRI